MLCVRDCKAGLIWSHTAFEIPDALHFSRQNRGLRKQLFFYDFSDEPKARQGRAFPSHGRGPRFDPLCVRRLPPWSRPLLKAS